MTIDGLRIVNYNYNAAKLKHGREAYDFYDHESLRPVENFRMLPSLL